jgi:hypothetical protein
LPPLPRPAGPLARPAEVTRAVYEFAARHSEVVRSLPCFCGCRRDGHQSNRDCFVAATSSAGQVTWDAHGMG